MAAYFVVNADITDPELLAAYRAAARATFEGHDLRLLVSTSDAEVIEGEPKGRRVVILEFPDKAAFRAWYDSPAYQEIIKMRLDSTDGFALLAE